MDTVDRCVIKHLFIVDSIILSMSSLVTGLDWVCETESPGSRDDSGNLWICCRGNSASDEIVLFIGSSVAFVGYRMEALLPILDLVAHVSPGCNNMGL